MTVKEMGPVLRSSIGPFLSGGCSMDYEFDPDGRGLHLRLTEAELRAVHTLATSASVPDQDFIDETLFAPMLDAKADVERWLEQRLHDLLPRSSRP